MIYELPDVIFETTEFFFHFQKLLRVSDGGFDFEAVADDAWVVHQLLFLFFIIFCDFPGVEIIEGFPVILPFIQHDFPAQTCLCAFQNQKFEKLAVIVHRDTPFLVMIADHDVTFTPVTALDHNKLRKTIFATLKVHPERKELHYSNYLSMVKVIFCLKCVAFLFINQVSNLS